MSNPVSRARQDLALYLTRDLKTTPVEIALGGVFTGVMQGMKETSGKEIDTSIKERAWGVFFRKNADDVRKEFLAIFCDKFFYNFTDSDLSDVMEEVKVKGKIVNETYRSRIKEAFDTKCEEITRSVVQHLHPKIQSLVSDIVAAVREEGQETAHQ